MALVEVLLASLVVPELHILASELIPIVHAHVIVLHVHKIVSIHHLVVE